MISGMSWSMIKRPIRWAFGSSASSSRRRERPGDLDAPLVTVAETTGELVGLIAEAEPGEQPVRDRARRRPAQAASDRAGFDVLAHGQVPKQPHDLKRPGDPAAGDLVRRQPRDVVAVA